MFGLFNFTANTVQIKLLIQGYQRYLEKVFRRELKMVGTPVRIEFKAGENPFTENRNKLTARQISRKRRIKTDFSKDKPGKKR